MTKEDFKDGAIYLGNALDLIKEIDADCFLADPPYGLGEVKGTKSKARKKSEYDTDVFEDTPEYIQSVCAPIVQKCIDKFSRGAITPGGKCAWFYPMPDTLGGYEQPAASGMTPWGRATIQPILFYGRDPLVGKTINPISYKLTEKPEDVAHPCPKPLKGWTWLLRKVSLEGETVFDPFMGSGTTAIACLRSSRRFIGAELEPKFFDLTCKRIDDFYRQGDFFR